MYCTHTKLILHKNIALLKGKFINKRECIVHTRIFKTCLSKARYFSITVLVERHQNSDNLPTSLEDLTEKKDRIIWNINNCRTKLNESRVRYVEIQASLSECEAIIEKTAAEI
jgi:hypothetical protein